MKIGRFDQKKSNLYHIKTVFQITSEVILIDLVTSFHEKQPDSGNIK